jgi:hypothetical protein
MYYLRRSSQTQKDKTQQNDNAKTLQKTRIPLRCCQRSSECQSVALAWSSEDEPRAFTREQMEGPQQCLQGGHITCRCCHCCSHPAPTKAFLHAPKLPGGDGMAMDGELRWAGPDAHSRPARLRENPTPSKAATPP